MSLFYLELSPNDSVDASRGIPPGCAGTKGQLFICHVIVALHLDLLFNLPLSNRELLLVVITQSPVYNNIILPYSFIHKDTGEFCFEMTTQTYLSPVL